MHRESRDPIPKPPPASQSTPQPQASRPPMDQRQRSPPRSSQWLHSDEPDKPGSGGGGVGGGAIVAVEKYYSPLQSPFPLTPPKDTSTLGNLSANSNPHIINFNRAMREGTTSSAIVLAGGDGGDGCGTGTDNGGGSEKRRGVFGRMKWKKKKVVEEEDRGVVEQIVNRSRKELLLSRAALGLRVCELVLTLVSFTVMATDKTQGWSGDSFDRYKEYRFCFSVNVIAFAYSAFQAYDVSSHMVTGKHLIPHRFRSQFDFTFDQMLAYFLLSASSAATSKIDDWQTNWGKDLFTAKASASVSMSFLAFVGFALSSLISGFKLCNRDIG